LQIAGLEDVVWRPRPEIWAAASAQVKEGIPTWQETDPDKVIK